MKCDVVGMKIDDRMKCDVRMKLLLGSSSVASAADSISDQYSISVESG